MLRFDEGEEVFFDSSDYLSLEESVVANKEFVYGHLGYEIWMNELQSVKERRESFLRGMGFVELAPSIGKESEMMGFERVVEWSETVSSSSASSVNRVEENLRFNGRELNDESNCMVDELDHERLDDLDVMSMREATGSGCTQDRECVEECVSIDMKKKTMRRLWKMFVNKMKKNQCRKAYEVSKPIAEIQKVKRVNVQQNKKGCMELTAVYARQEIRAHEGLIWTMKFSPNGQYLASGGEDGVVRIWHVTSIDASSNNVYTECNSSSQRKEGKTKSSHAMIVIPDKVFQIAELPLHEFHGHTSDVLDLAWSKSNYLLSSSKDKTVRLWQVGCDKCLGVFCHSNYVTCTQFNPIDENYFISGSIDGKVRIWGVSERRVVDWADARDAVTAICYQPDGKGFIVGTIRGTCRIYEASGSDLQLNTKIRINGRKKSCSSKITGIQFTQEDTHRVMISSEDSKIRILDGVDIVHKYKGLPKSGSQMSASFTSTGKHIISVGDNSRVYLWNYDDPCVASSKKPKSVRSCEHFLSEGVSVAIPWLGTGTENEGSGYGSPQCCSQTWDSSWGRDSDRFSLASWFSLDGSCRGSATWPEEKLPLWDEPEPQHDHHLHRQKLCDNSHDRRILSATWGLVIVTAGWDGMIRTFQNYGLPTRI